MKRLISAAILSGVAAVSLVLAAPASADVATTDCPDTLVLYVGGTKSFTMMPWDEPAPASIPQRDRYDSIPNSESEEIDYPASIFPFLGWDLWMDSSVAYGNAATQVRIADQEAKCGAGETQYLIVGYSQGAIVAGDVADAYASKNPEFAKSNINVVTYSDPRQKGGVEDVLAGVNIFGKIKFVGTRESTPDDFRSYENFCEPKDGVCDMAKPWTPFWLTRSLFGYFGYHGTYHNDEYDVPGTYVPPIHEEESVVDPPIEDVVVEDPSVEDPVQTPVVEEPVIIEPVVEPEPVIIEDPEPTVVEEEEPVVSTDTETEVEE